MTREDDFKNHIATLDDYGKIKVLTFQEPGTLVYFIRFTFDEELCKLYISGDLGELIASNYSNMTYERFNDFVNNTGYFISKIDCCSRSIYEYDLEQAESDLRELIEEEGVLEKDYDSIEDFLEEALYDFTVQNGIGHDGFEVCSDVISDFWECASRIGRKSTGIIELYLRAFELAKAQIDNKEK